MKRFVNAESVQLVFSGQNYFDVLEEIILSAKEILHLQTYIFADDETGTRIASALKKAGARGVNVFVLADNFGSKSLSEEFIDDFKKAGVNFRMFAPLFSSESSRSGRRLHHKILVADKNIALIGGINIADKYRGKQAVPAWLDYAVLVKGGACEYLDSLCEKIYHRKPGMRRLTNEFEKNIFKGEVKVGFRRNDWLSRKKEIHKSYRSAIEKAEQSIIIVASYFLPGFFFRNLLRKVRRRGVEISIIVAGKSDMPLVRNAERFLYGFLLRNGIRIFEWPNSVMHGKAIVTDGKWASIGSYNLNYLSRYRSIELNVDVQDEIFALEFTSHLKKIMKENCEEITADNFPLKTGLWQRVKMFLSYYLIRFMFYTFLPRQRD